VIVWANCTTFFSINYNMYQSKTSLQKRLRAVMQDATMSLFSQQQSEEIRDLATRARHDPEPFLTQLELKLRGE
jgi:hypothetical protein